MLRRNRENKLPDRTNNIWNRYDFAMCGLGEKSKLWAKIKHIKRCLCWSKQRIVRGYSDFDTRNMHGYLQKLFPDMLQNLKDNCHGSPGFLGENYINDKGILVNETCHAEWDQILDRMVFLWKETDEDTHNLEQYRNERKDEAMGMLKQYFFALWD